MRYSRPWFAVIELSVTGNEMKAEKDTTMTTIALV